MDNPIHIERNPLHTELTRGFLGLGRREKYTVEITIENMSQHTKMNLSISGRNRQRVELRAAAVFAKLQSQANQGKSIDLSKISITANDIESQEGIQKNRLATSINKIITRYLKTRTEAAKVIKNPSFSWFGSRLEKAAKRLHRGDISRKTALKADDFSIKYFAKEMKILKNCQAFDPSNKAQLRAWGMLYAKMRVVAAEHDITKTADLLSNPELQAILQKGVDFFGGFEFLSSGKPNEKDAVLKEQNISVKYVKGMVKTFKHVLDLTHAEVPASVQLIKDAVARQEEQALSAGYLSALGNKHMFNAFFKNVVSNEELSQKNFDIHQRELATKFYQLQSKYMEKFFTALNNPLEKSWTEGTPPTNEQIDTYISKATAHFDLIFKLANDYNTKYNKLQGDGVLLDQKLRNKKQTYDSVGDYIQAQGSVARQEFIYFIACGVEKDIARVESALREVPANRRAEKKFDVVKLLRSSANIKSGALMMVSAAVMKSKRDKLEQSISHVKEDYGIISDYEMTLKIVAELKSVAHEGVAALEGALNDKQNKKIFKGNDAENLQLFSNLLADIENLDYNGEDFLLKVQQIVSRLTPDFLAFLQKGVATEVSVKNEKLKGAGGGGSVDPSLATEVESYMLKKVPVMATKEALESARSSSPSFGVFVTQRLTRIKEIVERIPEGQRREGVALLIENLSRTVDLVNAIPDAIITCNISAIAILSSEDKPRIKKSAINKLFKEAIKQHPHLKGSLEVAQREALACNEGVLNTREYYTRYHKLEKFPLPADLQEVGFYAETPAPVETFIKSAITTLEALEKPKAKKAKIDRLYKEAYKQSPPLKEALKIAYNEALACHQGILKTTEFRQRYPSVAPAHA